MRSYARYYLETFRLQVIPDERIVDEMHVNQQNLDLTLEHLKNGRGVIYALPHMGDFEQAGRWVILVGAGSFTTVAERLKPESVFERWLKFRQGLGMEVLPTTGGPHPFGVMAQRLRAGKLVVHRRRQGPVRHRRRGRLLRREGAVPGRPGGAGGADRGGADAGVCWFEGEHRVGRARLATRSPSPPTATASRRSPR